MVRPLALQVGRLEDWSRAIGRVRRIYRAMHGRRCRLLRPRRYTDKVQWRKLFQLDPRFAILCDKIAVRDFIAERVGTEPLTPLLWTGREPEAVPLETMERPFIVKGRHAAGQVFRVKASDKIDIEAARATFRQWMRYNHGKTCTEPGYSFVEPGLMVERLLSRSDGSPPIERKVWVFHGRVRLVQTLLNDGVANHHAAFHDRLWRRHAWYLLSPPNPEHFEPPPHLERIVEVAERLGAEFDHIRVDFYDTHDRIWIGEMTPYPYSGMVPFTPDEADYIIGSYWRIERPMSRALGTILRQRFEIRNGPDGVRQPLP
jgi:hypothetical protein